MKKHITVRFSTDNQPMLYNKRRPEPVIQHTGMDNYSFRHDGEFVEIRNARMIVRVYHDASIPVQVYPHDQLLNNEEE